MAKGVSNCTVIHTKTEASKRYDKKKVKRRIKRAKQCTIRSVFREENRTLIERIDRMEKAQEERGGKHDRV